MPSSEQFVDNDLEALGDRFAIAAMAEAVEGFAVDFVIDKADRAIGKQCVDAARVGGAEAIREVVVFLW